MMLALADHADDNGRCWPSHNTIAKKCKLSRRYVIDLLSKLEKEEHIRVERRNKQSNVYHIVMLVRPASLPEAEASEPEFTTPVNQGSLASEAEFTTPSEAGITTLVRHTSHEPSINHQIETPEEPPIYAAEPAASGPQAGQRRQQPPPLTEGQRLFLETFGASRFKNNVQRDLAARLEVSYGLPKLTEAVTWAAKRGMTLGEGLTSIEKVLPNWGAPKIGSGSRASPCPPAVGVRDLLKQRQQQDGANG